LAGWGCSGATVTVCVEKISKKEVVPVVHEGKVEIRVKRLRERRLRVCPVFQNVAVQFRTIG
jgi:hypothetical protein